MTREIPETVGDNIYCLNKQNSVDDKINKRIPRVTKLPDPTFISLSLSLRNLM
jgi:hypothetical protein